MTQWFVALFACLLSLALILVKGQRIHNNEEKATDVLDKSIEPWDVNDELAVDSRSGSSSKEPLPRDCADLFDTGHNTSDVYTVYLGRKNRPLGVYCDMTTSGGGWTIFQRRMDGSINFVHGWNYYENGFGSVHGEFWLGNKNIHALTLGQKYKLRIDLADFSGEKRWAEYNNFRVGDSCNKYKLQSVGTYCGNSGDALTHHVGQKFSTSDQDNDSRDAMNCAATHKGGWWYNNCHWSNLNGLYLRGKHASFADGVNWHHWHGSYYSLKTSEMKIRPADFDV